METFQQRLDALHEILSELAGPQLEVKLRNSASNEFDWVVRTRAEPQGKVGEIRLEWVDVAYLNGLDENRKREWLRQRILASVRTADARA